jgi:hypothetical protein
VLEFQDISCSWFVTQEIAAKQKEFYSKAFVASHGMASGPRTLSNSSLNA